jgi:hypothetical protein
MSMNLKADKLELWQTPTWVTRMCLYTVNEVGETVQDTWQAIRFRYTEWVKSSLNGVWDDSGEYEQQQTIVRDHLRALRAAGEMKFWEA